MTGAIQGMGPHRQKAQSAGQVKPIRETARPEPGEGEGNLKE